MSLLRHFTVDTYCNTWKEVIKLYTDFMHRSASLHFIHETIAFNDQKSCQFNEFSCFISGLHLKGMLLVFNSGDAGRGAKF